MVDSVLRIPCRWLDNAFHDLFEVENGIFFSEDVFGVDGARWFYGAHLGGDPSCVCGRCGTSALLL